MLAPRIPNNPIRINYRPERLVIGPSRGVIVYLGIKNEAWAGPPWRVREKALRAVERNEEAVECVRGGARVLLIE